MKEPRPLDHDPTRRPLRVCFLYRSIFRHGGVQRVIASIANGLCEDFEIDVLCSEPIDPNKNYYGLKTDRVRVRHLDFQPRLSRLRNWRKKVLSTIARGLPGASTALARCYVDSIGRERLQRYLRHRDYDVVVGCLMSFNMMLGSVADKLTGAVVGWENNSFDWYVEGDKGFVSNEGIIRVLLARLDRLVLLTQHDCWAFRNRLGVEGISVPNPLGLRPVQLSDGSSKRFLTIGRLEKIKGTDLLVEAFRHFCRYNSDWRIRIVGEGELQPELERSIAAYGLSDRVELVPFTTDVEQHFIDSSVYLCASRYESFGLSVLEAMGCGLPIVTSDASGPSELVRHECEGLVFPRGNIERFSSAMIDIVKDSARRAEMGRNAVVRAKDYSLDRVVGQWRRLLREVAAEKGRLG